MRCAPVLTGLPHLRSDGVNKTRSPLLPFFCKERDKSNIKRKSHLYLEWESVGRSFFFSLSLLRLANVNNIISCHSIYCRNHLFRNLRLPTLELFRLLFLFFLWSALVVVLPFTRWALNSRLRTLLSHFSICIQNPRIAKISLNFCQTQTLEHLSSFHVLLRISQSEVRKIRFSWWLSYLRQEDENPIIR